MSATTDLGKVSLTPKGEYDPAAVYERLDIVIYGGNSWLVLTDGVTGITPVEGENYTLLAPGALVDVASLTGSEQSLTLANNTEYRCAEPVTNLEITGFARGIAGKSEMWGIVFTAGETITVTVPESVVWAVAGPVFTPGSMYWITWTPMGDKYLAVWVELEAETEAEADEPADV